MGIDVWVLRDRSLNSPRQSVLVEANVPEFHLCFLNYQSFGVCLSFKRDQEVISPAAKRFIADIAFSMNGSIQQPTSNNLKWPMSRRESVQQLGKTAEEVVLQRLDSLPTLVLVFGNDAVGTIPGLPQDDSRIDIHNGRRILALDSIDELCQGAVGKRNLWRKLQRVRDT